MPTNEEMQNLDYTDAKAVAGVADSKTLLVLIGQKLEMPIWKSYCTEVPELSEFISTSYAEKFPDGDRYWDLESGDFAKRKAQTATPPAKEPEEGGEKEKEEPKKRRAIRTKSDDETEGKEEKSKKRRVRRKKAEPAVEELTQVGAAPSMLEDFQTEIEAKVEQVSDGLGQIDKRASRIERLVQDINWATAIMIAKTMGVDLSSVSPGKLTVEDVRKIVMGE